MTELM